MTKISITRDEDLDHALTCLRAVDDYVVMATENAGHILAAIEGGDLKAAEDAALSLRDEANGLRGLTVRIAYTLAACAEYEGALRVRHGLDL